MDSHTDIKSRQHVVVVGAGIVGLACAAALIQRGHAITVIDPHDPGTGCSYGNAGCFSLASIMPVGMPGVWRKVPGWLLDAEGPLNIPMHYAPTIAPWVFKLLLNSSPQRVRTIASELNTLLSTTLRYWLPLAQWAGAPELIQQNGWAVVYESAKALEDDRFGWKVRAEHGIQIEFLEGKAIHDLEPNLATHFSHMVYLPEQGQCLNPLRLSQALHSKLASCGAKFMKATAKDFSFQNGNVSAVITEQGTIKADHVVIAAGAFSKALAQQLGNEVPLETERGYHAMVETDQSLLLRPIMSAEGKFFASPMQDGLRFAGSVELGGLKSPPNYLRADTLLKKGKAMVPSLDCKNITKWMGFRPSLPDSKPVIGQARKAPNAWYAFGHGHIGLTAAAATGEMIADFIQHQKPHIDPTPFTPDRF